MARPGGPRHPSLHRSSGRLHALRSAPWIALSCSVALGCAATPSPTSVPVEAPVAGATEPCKVIAGNAASAARAPALPPGLQGQVALQSIGGDDRLALAGYSQAAWTADGKSLITAGPDVLMAWDPVSGALQRTVPLGLAGQLGAMAIAPDASLVALSVGPSADDRSAPRQVVLVRPADGAIRTLAKVGATRLRFSDDGKRLIGGTRLWDVASGASLWGGRGFSGRAQADLQSTTIIGLGGAKPQRSHSQWLGDGRRGVEIRIAGDTLTLLRWRPERGERVVVGTMRRSASSRFALSPNGHFFVAVDQGRATRWSLRDDAVDRFAVPKDIEALALSNDGASVAYWKYWRVGLLGVLPPGGAPVPTGKAVDMRVHLWSLSEGRERWAAPHDGSRLAFSADDRVLAPNLVWSLAREAYDVATGRRTKGKGRLLAIHPATGRALAKPRRRRPRIVELGGEQSWPVQDGDREQVIMRAANGAAVTLDEKGRYRIRGASYCHRLPSEMSRMRAPYPFAFSRDGTKLLGDRSAVRGRRAVSVWDTHSGRVVGGAALAHRKGERISVLPDTAELVVVKQDQMLRTSLLPSPVERARSWRRRPAPTRKFTLPQWGQTTGAGGDLLLPEPRSRGSKLSVLNLRRGPLLPQLPYHSLQAYAASSDGKVIAAAVGNSLRWRRRDGDEAPKTLELGARLEHLSFAPDDRTVAVATRAGQVHLVDVVANEEVAVVDLRRRYDRARLISWTGPQTLTIDTARGAEIVVRRTGSSGGLR